MQIHSILGHWTIDMQSWHHRSIFVVLIFGHFKVFQRLWVLRLQFFPFFLDSLPVHFLEIHQLLLHELYFLVFQQFQVQCFSFWKTYRLKILSQCFLVQFLYPCNYFQTILVWVLLLSRLLLFFLLLSLLCPFFCDFFCWHLPTCFEIWLFELNRLLNDIFPFKALFFLLIFQCLRFYFLWICLIWNLFCRLFVVFLCLW